MKTVQKIDISYAQILSIVKKMPLEDKIQLTKELQKDFIDFKLSNLLNTFKTNELDSNTINEEVEIIRQELYNAQKL